MAKIQFSDVTPPDKRSIRNIPIPAGGKRKVPVVIKSEPKVVKAEPRVPIQTTTPSLSSLAGDFNQNKAKEDKAYEYYYPKSQGTPVSQDLGTNFNKRSGSGKKFIFGGLIFLVIGGFALFMMTVFASATITVDPKDQMLKVELPVVGTLEIDPSAVRYEVLKVSKSETLSVAPTGEEEVELKAKGRIMVYNNFSTEPQRLIVRTRFETAQGLIYRIPESIVVPGKKLVNGVSEPGQIEVEVFADEAGEKYNIKKVDFTIPGFKNDPDRYKNFYAKSVTEMSGGFVGKQKMVTTEAKNAALANTEAAAKDFLQNDLKAKLGDESVLLSDGIIFETKALPQTEEGGQVVLGSEVTAYAILLNKQDLVARIKNRYLNDYPDWLNIDSTIYDFSGIKVIKKPDRVEAGQKLELELLGEAKLVALVDTKLISERLVGKNKGEAAKLIREIPGIDSLTTTLRPTWKRSFPEDPSKITVELLLQE